MNAVIENLIVGLFFSIVHRPPHILGSSTKEMLSKSTKNLASAKTNAVCSYSMNFTQSSHFLKQYGMLLKIVYQLFSDQ